MIACASCGSEFESEDPDQKSCADCASLVTTESQRIDVRKVADYTLQHELGAGRYATSWLAEGPDGSGVILKLLRAYAPDSETVQRFLDEAKRLGSAEGLTHRGLARLLDAGVHVGGALFLVYESGGETTLADELRGLGRIPAKRALELSAQLCEAIHALHESGLSHFDLKPANVGLAKEESGAEQAVLLDAATGHLLMHAGLRETLMLPISTVAYLAPEVAAGADADERADLYGVGVLLYQLLSGRLPVTGHTTDELLDAHRVQRPLRLRDVGRRVHEELEALLQRVLDKDPAARFSDGRELAAEMRRVAPLADQPTPDQRDEEIEDPLPVTVAAPVEPEVAPPPRARTESAAQLPRPPIPARPRQSWIATRRIATVPRRFSPAQIVVGSILAAAALLSVVAIAIALWPDSPRAPHKKTIAAPIARAEMDESAPAALGPTAAMAATTQPSNSASATPISASSLSHQADAKETAPAPAASATAHAPHKRSSAMPTQESGLAPEPSTGERLALAQKQLAHRDAQTAKQTLAELLSRPSLGAADRERATRMLSAAEAELQAEQARAQGDKPGAIDWYRKYLRLTDDAAERARVVREIQALGHSR